MSLFDASEYAAPEPRSRFEPDPIEADPVEVDPSVDPVVDPAVDPGPAEDTTDPVSDDDEVGGPVTEPDDDLMTEPDDELVEPDEPVTGQFGATRAPELPPEPDPARLWRPVVGQERAVVQLQASLTAPVHAYLFVGPPGSGKRTAATAFAAALLCPRRGCGTCDVCVRAVAQIHPDLTVVEREGPFISVDQAREIIRLASRSPIEGRRQILVLVDFHLVLNAGPTLLKIIEEPPASTIFVILAEQLPPELITIASRCVQVPFGALSAATIAGALVAEGIDREHAQRAAAAAGGRLDRARLLARDEFVGQRMSFWAELPRRLDGTGAAVASLAAEALALIDGAGREALESRQAEEVRAMDERLEILGGGRGTVGLKRDLAERHKREQKRLRDDELRAGLTALQAGFRTALAGPDPLLAGRAMAAISAVAEANEALIRNPSTALLLLALFLRIGPPTRGR